MDKTRDKRYLVSVIVPCFNHAHFLSETLECILAQSYSEWECIVVDDGSKDNTKEIIERYANKDNRIRYIYQENRGLSCARNNGIANAKGDFIQFLDSDDLITPDKFTAQLSAYEINKAADIIYSEYVCFSDTDRDKTWVYSRVSFEGTPADDLASQWEKKLSIPIHCFLYKKDCFMKWGLFDESLIYGKEDWDLHLRFAMGGARYVFTEGQMAKYRISDKSMTKRDSKKMLRGKLLLLKKYLFYPGLTLNLRLIFLRRYIYAKFFSAYVEKSLEIILKNSFLKPIINFIKKIR
jgi:hypothetical protein